MNTAQNNGVSIRGRVSTLDHFFFIIIGTIIFIGCTPEMTHQTVCGDKLSPRVQHVLAQVENDTTRISVVITLQDSVGISTEFPFITVQTARVALGHLTPEEISILCKHTNVQYIDTPKMRFPTQ